MKPDCYIGTVGHVDHGGSSLTAVITEVPAETGGATFMTYDQIDKVPEEKGRGITISTAHVEWGTALREGGHTVGAGVVAAIADRRRAAGVRSVHARSELIHAARSKAALERRPRSGHGVGHRRIGDRLSRARVLQRMRLQRRHRLSRSERPLRRLQADRRGLRLAARDALRVRERARHGGKPGLCARAATQAGPDRIGSRKTFTRSGLGIVTGAPFPVGPVTPSCSADRRRTPASARLPHPPDACIGRPIAAMTARAARAVPAGV